MKNKRISIKKLFDLYTRGFICVLLSVLWVSFVCLYVMLQEKSLTFSIKASFALRPLFLKRALKAFGYDAHAFHIVKYLTSLAFLYLHSTLYHGPHDSDHQIQPTLANTWAAPENQIVPSRADGSHICSSTQKWSKGSRVWGQLDNSKKHCLKRTE